MIKILAINPGNTSTKIGYFENEKPIFTTTVRHSTDELSKFKNFYSQLDYRFKAIDQFIAGNKIDLNGIDYFIGRGGYLKPLASGLYKINEKMIKDLQQPAFEHASNLGALIAYDFAKKYNKEAFVLDPICVDELDDISRISGHPLFERTSLFHALNQKRMARHAAEKLKKPYEKLNLIVAMLGSGISVGIHSKSRVIDVTNAVVGEGPFSPERSGAIPIMPYLKYVLDNKLNYEDAVKLLYGKGGIVAYLGTNNFSEVMEKYLTGGDENNKKVKLIVKAMAYQIAKEIAAMSVAVCGNLDAIVLTGGMANEKAFVNLIIERIKFICPKIFVFPGEDELAAMAEGVIAAKNGQIKVFDYE